MLAIVAERANLLNIHEPDEVSVAKVSSQKLKDNNESEKPAKKDESSSQDEDEEESQSIFEIFDGDEKESELKIKVESNIEAVEGIPSRLLGHNYCSNINGNFTIPVIICSTNQTYVEQNFFAASSA